MVTFITEIVEKFGGIVPSEYRDVYYTFNKGIATGYSQKINPDNCR